VPPPPPQQLGSAGISAIFRNATSTLLEAGEPRVCRWVSASAAAALAGDCKPTCL
jgi:hypothetical protein